MPVLERYDQFGSLHWETGSFYGALAYLGVRAPHTGEPFSEAMLLGLGRGIGCMYFAFEYEGLEPHFFFSTRQVRVGGDTASDLCRRLGLEADTLETADPAAAQEYLERSLAAGRPVILWADRARLPWGWAPTPAGPWLAPILVYGLEGAMAQIADRARVPLACTLDELTAAWGAPPKMRYKALTLGAPASLPDLRGATAESIRTCMEGFSKGPNAHFGLAALDKWASLMTDQQDPKGWPRLFGTEPLLYANLVRAYMYIELEGTGGGAARPLYADFLAEAADLLGMPDLRGPAAQFRECGARWTRLANTFLPDYFRRVREVLLKREARFRAGGLPGVEESRRLEEIAAQAEIPNPAGLRDELRRLLLEIHAAELQAVSAVNRVLA